MIDHRRRTSREGRPLAALARLVALALALVFSAVTVATPVARAQQGPPDTAPTTTSTSTPAPSSSVPPTSGDGRPSPGPAPPLPQATPGPLPAVDRSPPAILPTAPDAAPRASAAGRREAAAQLRAAERELKAAQVVEAHAAAALRSSETKVREADARLAQRGAEEREAARRLGEARAKLRSLAVGQYVMGGYVGPSVEFLVRAQSGEELVRRGTLLSSASDYHRSVAGNYEQARLAAAQQIDGDVRALEQANAERAKAAADQNAAFEQVLLLSGEVDHRRLLLDLVTAGAPVGASDIPRILFDAYRRAASVMQREARACRLGWSAIAAIGKVEADHGRFRGSQVALNGDLFPPIIGIRLDGTSSAVITDTDGGQLDGDPAYDRAVGPMQFIPSTWRSFARDGNRDGVSNVHNAYDAALGAAAYLCRAVGSGRLDTEEGLRVAFFSYNHSQSYVEAVLAWVRTYDALKLPPPPPVRGR